GLSGFRANADWGKSWSESNLRAVLNLRGEKVPTETAQTPIRNREMCQPPTPVREQHLEPTQTDRSLQAASTRSVWARVDILQRVGLSRTPLVFEHGERLIPTSSGR